MRFPVEGRDAGVWKAGGWGADAGWRESMREGGGEGGWRGACCSAHDLLLWAPLVMAGWCRGAELSLSSCKHWSALQHRPLHHHLHLHHHPSALPPTPPPSSSTAINILTNVTILWKISRNSECSGGNEWVAGDCRWREASGTGTPPPTRNTTHKKMARRTSTSLVLPNVHP